MAISQTGAAETHNRNSAGTTQDFTVTVPSGCELLVACINTLHLTSGTPNYVDSVTYNGSSMSLAVAWEGDGSASRNVHQGIWYLVSPPTGANTLTVTMDGAAHSYNIATIYLEGVDTSTPFGATDGGLSGDSAVDFTLTTTVDDSWLLEWAGCINRNESWTPTSPAVEITDEDVYGTTDNQRTTCTSLYRTVSSAGSAVIESTCSPASGYFGVAAVVNAAASGSASVSPAAAQATSGATAPAVVRGSQSIAPSSADSTVSASIGAVAVASTQSPEAAQVTSGASVGSVFGGSVSVTPQAAQATSGATAPAILYGSTSLSPSSAKAATGADQSAAVSGSQSVSPAAAQATTAATAPTVTTSSTQSPAAAQVTSGASVGAVVQGSQSVSPAAAQATSGASVILGTVKPGPAVVTTSASISAAVQGSISLSPATAQAETSAQISGVTGGYLQYMTLRSREISFTLISRGVGSTLNSRGQSLTLENK